MTSDFAGDLIIVLFYTGSFSFALGAGAWLFECMIPKFPRLERTLFGLFGIRLDEFEEEEDEK